MADPRLDIHIKTSADTSGAKAAAAAVKQAGDATKDAGKQAQQTAKNVDAAGESFEKGAAAGRVLAAAMQGNLAAITQLGPALKALGAALKTNLIGMLVTLGGLLASTVIPLIVGFRKKLDETEESAKRANEALQLKKDAIEEVSRAISQLAKDADTAEKELRTLQSRNDAIADAKLAQTLAEIRAREDLTDVQRLTMENEAREARAREKRQNERGTNEAIIGVRQRQIAGARAQVDETSAQLGSITDFGQSLRAQRASFEASSRAERLTMARSGAPAAAIEAQANATQRKLSEFDAAIEAAGNESMYLAEQLEKARKAFEQVQQANAGAIQSVQAEEQLQATLFGINQATNKTTFGVQLKQAVAKQRIDTSGLLARQETLAAEAARLEQEAAGGDFSFGGALKRSAAAEALDRNRQEMARVDAELLDATRKNHAAEMAARQMLVDEQKAQKRDTEKLNTQVKNTRP